MTERGGITPFVETIKDAPEFSGIYEANIFNGLERWPIVQDQGNSTDKKVVFTTENPRGSEIGDHRVVVSYEAPYGLKARKALTYRKPESDFLLEHGEVRYNFGDVDIVYSQVLSSPFVFDSGLRDKTNFFPAITVEAHSRTVPPLAIVKYEKEPQFPIDVEFPLADYEQALAGDVETRQRSFGRADHRKSFFSWEHLKGPLVGISKFDNPSNPDFMRYYRWYTQIGAKPTTLPDSPYSQKISRSTDRRTNLGGGRLRFSRMNNETGESWMLSVPEWIDKGKYADAIEGRGLEDFFQEYPVIFCVKKTGEERKWFSTFYTRDKSSYSY